ncbi:hypothetical protein Tco_0866351, partial [Tanacetum coccineum]
VEKHRQSPSLSALTQRLSNRPQSLRFLQVKPELVHCTTSALLTEKPVAASGVPRDGSRVHTHDHDGSEAPDESPNSTLSSKPKPLGKHRPPPPPSILSPRESSYPP